MNLMTKISGLHHLDWVAYYYALADDMLAPENEQGVNFIGVTNPHHVTLANVKKLVLLAVERYQAEKNNKGESVTFYQEVKGVVDWLCESGGLWKSEESIKIKLRPLIKTSQCQRRNSHFILCASYP